MRLEDHSAFVSHLAELCSNQTRVPLEYASRDELKGECMGAFDFSGNRHFLTLVPSDWSGWDFSELMGLKEAPSAEDVQFSEVRLLSANLRHVEARAAVVGGNAGSPATSIIDWQVHASMHLCIGSDFALLRCSGVERSPVVSRRVILRGAWYEISRYLTSRDVRVLYVEPAAEEDAWMNQAFTDMGFCRESALFSKSLIG